jgi:hypothetical protein
MSNTTKLTKVQKFEMLKAIPAVAEDAVLVEFIDHEIDLLAKRNAADRKPTAQQTANEVIKDAIYEGMDEGVNYTITDLIKTIPECADLTNQRVSALIRQMMPDRIERIEDKRKAYFRKVVQ